jgi:hypothetical protein
LSNVFISGVTCCFLSTEQGYLVFFLLQSNVGSSTGTRYFLLFPTSVVFIFTQ